MSPPRFHPEARQDFDEAVAFLAERSPAAARSFAYRITQVINLITAFPEAGNPIIDAVRTFPVHPFSHDLVYRTEPDGSWTILAVAHHRRRPAYWRHRVG